MWLARIAMLAWAGVWLWFTFAHVLARNPACNSSENADPNELAPSLLAAIPILLVAILAWLYPRIGGVALILAAIFAAWSFDGAAARLALPPALIGILMIAITMSKLPSEPRA